MQKSNKKPEALVSLFQFLIDMIWWHGRMTERTMLFFVFISLEKRSAFMRTLTRFILLSWLLFMRQMCRPMARRFPTLHSIHRIGLILRHEAEMLERMARFEDKAKMSLYVINWAIYMVREAKDQGHFEISNDVARVLDPILAFKKSCSSVLKFKETEFPQSFLQVILFLLGSSHLYFHRFYLFLHQPFVRGWYSDH